MENASMTDSVSVHLKLPTNINIHVFHVSQLKLVPISSCLVWIQCFTHMVGTGGVSDANTPDGNHAPVMMSLVGRFIRKQHRISLYWIVVLTTVSRAPLKLLSLFGFLWGVFTCLSLCAGFWFHETASGDIVWIELRRDWTILCSELFRVLVTFIHCKYKPCTHWEASIWVLPLHMSHDTTAFFPTCSKAWTLLHAAFIGHSFR